MGDGTRSDTCPASGGLVRLQTRLTHLTTWLGPAWAVLCGVIASGGFGWQGKDWLRLALLILLVDGGWGTLWAASGGTDWATLARRWHNWRFGEPVTALPYTLPGSPGDRVSRWLGQMCAWWRDVFAFYPNKQMTTGEGGTIVTDHDDWDALFRSLRNQGRDVFDAWLNHSRLGYNYRMDEMSAALGASQLSRIEELLAKRDRVAGWYHERLAEVTGVQTPYIAPTTTRMSWFVYVVRIAPEIGRARVMAELQARGIPSRPYFTPIHLQPFYAHKFGYRRGDFPVTEEAGDACLALPFSGVMTEEQVDYVCRALQEAVACA